MSRVTIPITQEDLRALDTAAGIGKTSREEVAGLAFNRGLEAAALAMKEKAQARAKLEAEAKKAEEEAELERARDLIKTAEAKKGAGKGGK